ncbi:hypothetical protein niasHT_034842 [Heterodera trifolii]|uniref:Bestrophin homolog n=1 Tax=Heterodera trifolii TaxID=157864 RepID=A0ABD2IKX8_9BILA
MTVSYNQDIINTHSLTFLRVIFRWRGSVWKSVFFEVSLWLLCYYTVLFVYRTQLNKGQQIEFEHIAKYTDSKIDYIPLSFMHGFYVAFVVDSAAFLVGTFVGGTDAEARTHRRNFIRYLCLTQVLVLRDISIRVRRRFPAMKSLVEAGYIQEHELRMMESIQNGFPRYWVPIHWVFTLAHQLMRRGRMTPGQMEMILNESRAFREKLQMLINYDWVPVPLAYSQVVFLATRVYFLLCLFGRQFRIWEQRDSMAYFEYYFPLMTFLQLMCYMGWLKMAESLLNPLGEDDEDFESGYIIDRNLAVGMTMVDEFYGQLPTQKPDKFGKEGEVPSAYTELARNESQHQLVGSAKLAAENNPSVLEGTAERQTPPTNRERKRSSIFGRFLQRASGDRIGTNDAGRKRHNRSLFGTRWRSATTAGPMSAEEGKDKMPWKQRKSKSIACAPFATSYDKIIWPPPKNKGTDEQQLNFDKTSDGQILGKLLLCAQSKPRFSIDFDEFKQLGTLNEEDAESIGRISRSRSNSRESDEGT